MTKSKAYLNLRSLVLEANSTLKARENLLAGVNIVFDGRASNLDKYDFGLSWEPSTGAFIGLKHESTSKERIQPGKFLFFFHHIVSQSQIVGTEFALDYQKRAVAARLGFLHKFNDDTSFKTKVNQVGNVDLALKHRFNSLLTVGAVTSFSLQTITAEQKTKTLPLGFSVDLKF